MNVKYFVYVSLLKNPGILNGTLKRRDKIFKCLNSIKVFKLIFFLSIK